VLRETGEWDIRCPKTLKEMFKPPRKGYWFKINRVQARQVCKILARAYKIQAPQVDEITPTGWNGWYHPKTRTISVWARAHLKSVFHEFYHHLDEMTQGAYDSSDHPGKHRLTPATGRTTEISLAWQFADKLFDALRQP
jgi:hypothetical protein